MSRPASSTSLREVAQTVVPVMANVSEDSNRGSVLETSRITETEAEEEEDDSASHYRVQGVAGDAARVLAISNETHVAAFPPTGPPTENTHRGFIKQHFKCGVCAIIAHNRDSLWCFSRPVFDEPVVLSSFRAVAHQQHRVAQVVGVTVGLLINS